MLKMRRNTLTALILTHLALIAGQAAAQDANTGAQAKENVTDLGTVQVQGRRAADRQAIDDKRNSGNQSDTVRADDVGRLPDQNVAEAVRRLPGVTTVNDQGEGRYLTVRGVSPDLLNVTLNGQSAAAPEPDGRQVKLDDIPSSLIGAVKVSKTLTPDMDANAIAGNVDIETVSAFDHGGNFGTARVAYGYADINGSHPWEYDASYGGLFGARKQFSVVVAVNQSDRKLAPQNVQNSGDWIDVDGHVVPEGIDIRQYNTHRQRGGAVANFDWWPNEDTKLFLRLMQSKYQDSETRDRFGVEMDEDGITPTSDTTGTFVDGSAFRTLRVRSEDTSTTSASMGGRFQFEDSTLSVEATFSRADKKDPHRDEWTFETGDISGSYQLDGDSFTVTPSGSAAFDPSLYELDAWEPESRRALEKLFQIKADYTMQLEVGDGSELQFGLKHLDRKKSNDENGEAWGYDDGDFTMADASRRSIDATFGGRYPFGPVIDNDMALDYFNSHLGEFERDDDDTLSATLSADYRIREKVTAAYAMSRLRFGAFTVIPGVRVERTQGAYSGKSFVLGEASLDQGFNNTAKKSYTDWFPGVNFTWDAGKDLVIRAAATRAIGRPNYETLAPFVLIEDAASSEPEVSMGNPDLQPLYSTNLDASIEHYMGNRGLLSAAVFYKRIRNPIYETTLSGQDGTFGGMALVNAEVGTWTNADRATLRGLELNAQYELSFLPAPFDGFSVGGNITFARSSAKGLPNRSDSVPLLNQSDRVASAQVSYEHKGFSARLAYVYRSPQLLEVSEDDPEADVYVDAFDQWDLKLSYAINPKITVFLEGANINNAPHRTYIGYANRMGEKELSGWSVRTGLQISF